MARKKYLICGGREYSGPRAWDHVRRVLDEERDEIGCIVQGECHKGGADKLGEDWAVLNGIPCIGMKANFKKYGNIGGPVRNQWMLDWAGPIDKVIAFPGGTGTNDMIERALAAGIEVRDERGGC